MADEKVIIGASLQVDTGTSNANIKEVKKNLTDVKGALSETGTAAKSAGKDLEGAGGSFSKIREQMTALPGPLGAAGDGVGKLSGAFKALLANPVVAILGAIVAVLALLYKAFTNTFEGGEKVEQVFAGIKAIGQSLIDNLDKIASSIVKLFKFDFSGAIADMKAVGTAAADAFTKMAALTKRAQELKREQIEDDVDAAKRAKDLAVLREQANDEDVPRAKRIAALKELQKIQADGAKEDIRRAKEISENTIAQLTIQKDGAKKNLEEISKAKIDALNVETENANEARRIAKQITTAEKQEQAERTAAAKEANERQKADREKLAAFNNQLLKLQQENQLLTIKDGYEKERQHLENKFADEKRVNLQAFNDKKITREQFNAIEAAEATKADLQRAALTEKHNAEVQAKEVAFQQELAAISTKIKLAGITDSRELERVQLEIGYEEKLQQAMTRYKDDSEKLEQFKAALDEEFKAQKEKTEAKFKKEDDKKQFQAELDRQNTIVTKNNFDFDAKRAALDAEQEQIQAAFDAKLITEEEYNSKSAALTEARNTIRDSELNHTQYIVQQVAVAFSTLSDIAGKQTVVGKALAIASTTINTFQSAIAAFKGMVTNIPGPVGIALGAVAAAGAVASGIAAVKKIVAVQVPGQGGGGGSAPTGLPPMAAPVAPSQVSTKIDTDSIKGIGNAASRVFVLDSDVKNSREKDERLNRAARLGG